MGFQVFDYRKDIRNLLVAPQIRARFERIEVGTTSGGRRPGRGHSHDLGYEIWLVLQGQIEFEIGDDKQVLGPGQFCVARIDESHRLRNVGDEPAITYLSVTPHIQPTHTGWIDEDTKAPPRFQPSTNYHVPADRSTPTEELVKRHLQASQALSEIVEAAVGVQQEQAADLERALSEEDEDAMAQAREAMWNALAPMFKQVYALADAWNDLTYRTADREYGHKIEG
jgi:mannose-6-phosphate isomerase-like protein (cupin superfamily)